LYYFGDIVGGIELPPNPPEGGNKKEKETDLPFR
jgi:hypothetical protein